MSRFFAGNQTARVLELSSDFSGESTDELRERFATIRRAIGGGASDGRFVCDCFALTVESVRRLLGKQLYPVQIEAGLCLLDDCMVEMATGEGKTLTGVLPVMLRAFRRRGVHVVTANPYLAARDAAELQPVFAFAGLTTGCLDDRMSPPDKRRQYDCDVTFGTGSQFGFDFLRDRITLGPGAEESRPGKRATGRVLQRGHFFALIDEADVILIDDARTPLIIGGEDVIDEARRTALHWAAHTADQLVPRTDFGIDPKSRDIWLTARGCDRIALIPRPSEIDSIGTEELLNHVERSLAVAHFYARDRDYIVQNGQVQIVGAGTGRVLHGRKWQNGLHQAVEVRESVPVTGGSQVAAQMTVRQYFHRYRHLSGMTGTATPVRSELRQYYHMRVRRIPTHRPCVRTSSGVRVFIGRDSKHQAIQQRLQDLVTAGRAVLIGVPSVEESSVLTRRLHGGGCHCVLLNATRLSEEAEIIARAGTSGAVTVATNMAGRGTDIRLDPACRVAGGLHVLMTELNTARRFDRQLIGRAARQGDPGSYELMVCLDDELLLRHAGDLVRRLRERARPDSKGELDPGWIRYFRRVQRLVEKRDARDRKRTWQRELERQRTRNRAGLDLCLESVH